DPFVDMNAMVEIHELRQVVDPLPFNGPITAETLTDRFQHFAADPHLRVTVHARLRGWNSRECGDFDCGMTITAIKSQMANVMLMAKGDWLQPGVFRASDIRRAVHHHQRPTERSQDEQGSENAHLGKRVETAVEDLRH